ncbi:MAG TPA: thiamine pyrophosphate-binding protein [Actinoallomurus sp.]|nr:thiamine pyrophosphate-binding protein [Actinoallomurus sp.]
MAPTVGDYLLQRLREWGVERLFGYPGDGINGIITALGQADDQPEFVQARHEEMSALQAVGYAKFSGKPGLGPGARGRRPGRARRAL